MAFRAVGTAISTPTTSPSVACPAGVVAGDILLAAFTTDGNTGTMSAPDISWTAITGSPLRTPSGDLQSGFLFIKQATGAEPSSYNFTSSSTVVGVIGAWSARHATNYLHQSSALASATSGLSPASTAYSASTTVEIDEVWFGFADDGDVAITWTPPSGFTTRQQIQGVGNNFYQMVVASRDAVAAGVTGAYTGSRTGFGGGNGVFAVALAVGDTSTLTQERYCWRNDDGTESTATSVVGENTALTGPAGTVYRLRLQIDADGGNPDPAQYKLQSRVQGTGAWVDVLIS